MLRFILPACALALLPALAPADNWPQWRGPRNDGVSAEKGLPTEWGAEKNLLWKFKLPGIGSSTPAVWGDRLFLTAQEGADCFLLCVGTDGREKWRKKMGSGKVFTRADEGGNLATPSPTTDGKHVWALDGSGYLACYDLDGNQTWHVDCQKEFGPFQIQFGGHWTPALHKDRLYVVLLHRKAQLVIAFDASSGKALWQVTRKSDSPPGTESPDVYASPFVWANGDREALIVHGNDYCTAHSLTDGAELWRVSELNPKGRYNRNWRAVSSPLVTPDLVVVPSCKNGVTVAVDPLAAKGTLAPGNPAEKWRLTAGTPDVPSPLLVDGLVYLFRETEKLEAYDAATGQPIYSERVTGKRQRGNPVYADGKLYLLGRDGDLPVVKAGRSFELLAKNKLPDTFTASPAVANGRLYFRGWDYLWAVAAATN